MTILRSNPHLIPWVPMRCAVFSTFSSVFLCVRYLCMVFCIMQVRRLHNMDLAMSSSTLVVLIAISTCQFLRIL